MEPPSKRLCLLGPTESSLTNDYEPLEDYDVPYNGENFVLYGDKDNLEEEEEVDDDEEEEEEEEEEEMGIDEIGEEVDPSLELQQKRARLDNKLKSKFEVIFEKYGRDFTGIGDEIDLKTGEIVVNNGHLLEMKDERDAGTSRLGLLSAFTQENDENPEFSEVEDFELDGIDDSHIRVEDAEEDDSILLGDSITASKQPRIPPARFVDREGIFAYNEDNGLEIAMQREAYPSESEILDQFGEQLGPHIASYVSQQRVLDHSSVEAAWQTPGLPLATPGRRPILKSILLQPETDRSPSPEGSSSVWAAKMPRGRRRKDGADVDAVFRGETIIRDRKWYSSGYVSTTVTKQRTERASLTKSGHRLGLPLKRSQKSGTRKFRDGHGIRPSSAALDRPYNTKNVSDLEEELFDEDLHRTYRSQSHSGVCLDAKRAERFGSEASTELPVKTPRLRSKPTPFTEADDTAIVQWVGEAQRRGYSLWSSTLWNMLAEKNLRHSSGSWCNRYRRCLYPRGVIPALELGDVGQSDNEEVEGSSPPSCPIKVSIPTSETNPFYGVSFRKARQTLTPKKHRSIVLPPQQVEIIDLTGDDESSYPNRLQVDAPKSGSSSGKNRYNVLRSPKHSSIAIKDNSPLKKLSRNPFDASYDFSDDEEVFFSKNSKQEQPKIKLSFSTEMDSEVHQRGSELRQRAIGGYITAFAKVGGKGDNADGVSGQLIKSFQRNSLIKCDGDTTRLSAESEQKEVSSQLDASIKIADGESDSPATPIQKRSVVSLDDSAEIADSEDDATLQSDQELHMLHPNAPLIANGDGVDADRDVRKKQSMVNFHSPIRVDTQEEDVNAIIEQRPIVEQRPVEVKLIERGEEANTTSKQEQSITNSEESAQVIAGIAIATANSEREQPSVKLNPATESGYEGEVTHPQINVQKGLSQSSDAGAMPYPGGNRRPKWLEDALKAYQTAMSPTQPDWDPLSPVGLSKSSSPSRMSPSQVVRSESNLRTPINVSSSQKKSILSGVVPNGFKGNPEDAAEVSSPLSQRNLNALKSKHSVDQHKTPMRRPVIKRATPRNTSGPSSVKRRAGSSSHGSIVETPGGTVRRCGEKGYRCNRGFCFNCLSGE